MQSVRLFVILTAIIFGMEVTSHASAGPLPGTTRFVNGASGADSGDCTASPCQRIQYAIDQSSSGDTINISAGQYTDHLTVAKNLHLAGAGQDKTFLDGAGIGTVLSMNGGTVSVTDLAIEHGSATGIDGPPTCYSAAPAVGCGGYSGTDGTGGGIYLGAGSLTLTNTAVTANTAQGGQGGTGGATYDCPDPFTYFGGNGGTGGNGRGGGIYVAGGSLTVEQSSITANRATGGTGGMGGFGDCGGGTGGLGGNGQGANIYVANGTLKVDASALSEGTATGGTGGESGRGGASSGAGGGGGTGSGGGLYYGGGAEFSITKSTLQTDSAFGGVGGSGSGSTSSRDFGGPGGAGLGGGIELTSGSATLDGDSFIGDSATGAQPGQGLQGSDSGGFGSGGGLDISTGENIVNNSTFSGNQAIGTAGGNGLGGAVGISDGSADLSFDTMSGNSASGGSGGGSGFGGGVRGATETTLTGTIVSGNTADTGPDCSGSLSSLDHNIIHDATGCTISTQSGDQIGVDPLLSTLAANGGPTETIALLTGSPAIDKVPLDGCLKSDQRGVGRPDSGESNCDIGAYETTPVPTTTATVTPRPNAAGWNYSNVTVQLVAHPGTLEKGAAGPAIAFITYSATGAQPITQTEAKGATANIPVLTEGITTLTYFATDTAGDVEPPHQLLIKIDKARPSITGAPDRPPNANGWYNAPVTFTWTCSDSSPAIVTVRRDSSKRVQSAIRAATFGEPGLLTGSGVASCTAPTTLSNEGRSEVAVGTVTSVSGLRASTVITGINIDEHPPVSTAAVNPSPNGNGWNNTSPTVKITSLDPALTNGVNGSGVASITYSAAGAQTIGSTTVNASSVNIPITTEGITTVTFAATDLADNVEAPKTFIVRYDHTAPSIAVTGVTDGENYLGSATPEIVVTDPPPVGSSADTSGVRSQTLTLDGHPYNSGTPVSGVDYHTLVITAVDRAGNVATRHVKFLVYAFPSHGDFVLGDRTVANALLASSPTTVTFHGPQWVARNAVSVGSAPHGFQGFVTPIGQVCGGEWTGSSAPPPSTLPTYMAVLVTSSVTQSAGTAHGNIVEIVIVKPNLAVAGTGTIVATINCT